MPGIATSRTIIPLGNKAFDWDAFWAGQISATVENAAPTHVVLTFPKAASLVAADLTATIHGAADTIVSASWTGSVWTVVLTSTITSFDTVVMTFIKTGGTTAVINNVAVDGNTVAWFDSSNVASITKDGGNLVSAWGDLTGLGHHLLQAGADAIKPVWSANGILFDGNVDFMNAAFAYAQPEMIYLVIKAVSFGASDYILDGITSNKGVLRQKGGGVSPQVEFFANSGNILEDLTNFTVGSFHIVRLLFNGATSSLQIEEIAAVTGNAGLNSMGGITLGRPGDFNGQYSNIQVKEIILRKTADSAATQTSIYNYLANKYGFDLIP